MSRDLSIRLQRQERADAEPTLAPERPVAARAGRRDDVLRRLLALGDVAALAAALAFALLVVGGERAGGEKFASALLTLPVWILLFKLYGLYDRQGKRLAHATVDDVPSVFHALLTGAVAFWTATHVVPALAPSFDQALAFLLTAFPALLLARAATRRAVEHLAPPERVLLVGGGSAARVLLQKMLAHPEYGLEPVGYVDRPQSQYELEAVLPYLGDVEQLETVSRSASVDRIVIAAPAVDEAALADLVRVASLLDLKVTLLPQLSDLLGSAVVLDDVEGVTVLALHPPTLTPPARFLKRAMDVTLAAAALCALAPLMAVAAIAVRATSPGPVLYRQTRVGRGGRPFRLYKFRTMVADADRRVAELRGISAHPAWLLLDHDPRITPVGRLLRRTSIDELPQLWNVLKGEMSLVGPRPMPPDVDERISGWGRRRLDLTPGITGLWQVLGRTRIPFEEMVKLDYLYVTNWSLWQDIRLLVRTLPVVLSRRGAN